MRIEERADGLHISGYVNVTGKLSRPVITPRGNLMSCPIQSRTKKMKKINPYFTATNF